MRETVQITQVLIKRGFGAVCGTNGQAREAEEMSDSDFTHRPPLHCL